MQTLKPLALGLPAAITLLFAIGANAQYGAPKVATVTAVSEPAAVAPGGKGVLLVTMNVKPGFHVNANKPNDPAYIATVFSGRSGHGITYGTAHYPTARPVKVSYSPTPLLVYVGRAVIAVPYTVAKTAKPGKAALAGSVAFQGCDAKSCYPPASAQVRASVTVK